MKTLEDVRPHLRELSIFPLPDVVLFPYSMMPLHIFEERYIRMVQDARDRRKPLAIATILPDEVQSQRPRVESIAGVGFIESMGELPDGGFLIQVVGVTRVAIDEELPDTRPFRRAKTRLVEFEGRDADKGRRLLETLKFVLISTRTSSPKLARMLEQVVNLAEEPGVVADKIAHVLYTKPLSRLQILQQLDPLVRLNTVIEQLSAILARVATASHKQSLN